MQIILLHLCSSQHSTGESVYSLGRTFQVAHLLHTKLIPSWLLNNFFRVFLYKFSSLFFHLNTWARLPHEIYIFFFKKNLHGGPTSANFQARPIWIWCAFVDASVEFFTIPATHHSFAQPTCPAVAIFASPECWQVQATALNHPLSGSISRPLRHAGTRSGSSCILQSSSSNNSSSRVLFLYLITHTHTHTHTHNTHTHVVAHPSAWQAHPATHTKPEASQNYRLSLPPEANLCL